MSPFEADILRAPTTQDAADDRGCDGRRRRRLHPALLVPRGLRRRDLEHLRSGRLLRLVDVRLRRRCDAFEHPARAWSSRGSRAAGENPGARSRHVSHCSLPSDASRSSRHRRRRAPRELTHRARAADVVVLGLCARQARGGQRLTRLSSPRMPSSIVIVTGPAMRACWPYVLRSGPRGVTTCSPTSMFRVRAGRRAAIDEVDPHVTGAFDLDRHEIALGLDALLVRGEHVRRIAAGSRCRAKGLADGPARTPRARRRACAGRAG